MHHGTKLRMEVDLLPSTSFDLKGSFVSANKTQGKHITSPTHDPDRLQHNLRRSYIAALFIASAIIIYLHGHLIADIWTTRSAIVPESPQQTYSGCASVTTNPLSTFQTAVATASVAAITTKPAVLQVRRDKSVPFSTLSSVVSGATQITVLYTQNNQVSEGTLVGAVLTSVLVAVALIFGCLCWRRRRKNRRLNLYPPASEGGKKRSLNQRALDVVNPWRNKKRTVDGEEAGEDAADSGAELDGNDTRAQELAGKGIEIGNGKVNEKDGDSGGENALAELQGEGEGVANNFVAELEGNIGVVTRKGTVKGGELPTESNKTKKEEETVVDENVKKSVEGGAETTTVL